MIKIWKSLLTDVWQKQIFGKSANDRRQAITKSTFCREQTALVLPLNETFDHCSDIHIKHNIYVTSVLPYIRDTYLILNTRTICTSMYVICGVHVFFSYFVSKYCLYIQFTKTSISTKQGCLNQSITRLVLKR